jgi:hypothetical protein
MLSTLSAVLPKPLANNAAFMFTNISNPLSWNFSQATIPDILKSAPQFRIDNPVSLQRKYLKIRDDPETRTTRAEMRREVKAAGQDALETLVNLFDWLDGLEPQPASEAISRYEKSRNIIANIIGPLAKQMMGLLRKLRKVQEGVQMIKRIFTGE